MVFFRKIELSRKQIIETGVVAALVLLLVAIKTEHEVYIKTAMGVLLVSLIAPLLLKPLAYVWFGLAEILGFVSSKFILGIVFFLIVTPVALIRKAMKKDRLDLNSFKRKTASSYRNRNHTFTGNDFKHQF